MATIKRINFTDGFSSEVTPAETLITETAAAITVMGASNGGATLTGGSTLVDFTEVLDPDALWNGTQFVAKVAGNYRIDGAILINSNVANTYNAYVDGTKGISLSSDDLDNVKRLNGVVTLAVNETLDIRSNIAATLSPGTEHHHIAITKV